MEGKTTTGYKFNVDERVKEDWRFLEIIEKAQNGTQSEKIKAMQDLITLILGEKGKDALIKHIMKKNDGFCPVSAMNSEIKEIMDALNTKKS